jgi:ribonucleoside-diphosphate reductase alpha chain
VGNDEAPRVPAARVLSSGFVRRPNLSTSNVVVMSSASPAPAPVQALQIRAESLGALALVDAPVVETHVHHQMQVMVESAAVVTSNRRAEARMKGYEGDSCSECGNFTMVRNGTCLKCDTCGSTSGCS